MTILRHNITITISTHTTNTTNNSWITIDHNNNHINMSIDTIGSINEYIHMNIIMNNY